MNEDIQREEDLICEALVREIGRAPRWIARVQAWQALLSTRDAGKELREENCKVHGSAVVKGNTQG